MAKGFFSLTHKLAAAALSAVLACGLLPASAFAEAAEDAEEAVAAIAEAAQGGLKALEGGEKTDDPDEEGQPVVQDASEAVAQATEQEGESSEDSLSALSSDSSAWLPTLFQTSSYVYDNSTALLAADLCQAADSESDAGIIAKFSELGFQTPVTKNFGGNSAFAISDQLYSVNGKLMDVVVVVARGSQTFAEFFGDGFKGGTREFLGGQVYDNVYDFYDLLKPALKDYLSNNQSDMYDAEVKVLIAGHSLGGACANMLAADFDNGAYDDYLPYGTEVGDDDVYAYTFGAIKVLKDGSASAESGYENIHNVYNYYDSFGPYGANGVVGASNPGQYFGHTDIFNLGQKNSALFSYDDHVISRYIEGLEQHSANCNCLETFVGNLYGDWAGGFWGLGDDGKLDVFGAGEFDSLGTVYAYPVHYAQTGYLYRYDLRYLVEKVTLSGDVGSYVDGVTGVAANAFNGCANLRSVYIPSTVKSIGDGAFLSIKSGSVIRCSEEVAKLLVDGVNYDSSLTTVRIVSGDDDDSGDGYSGQCGDNVYWSYSAARHKLTITGTGDMWDWSGYDNDYAPWDSHGFFISSVSIGPGVTSIGDHAFEDCCLTSVSVPSTVSSIGEHAFCDCDSLASVTIPEGVASIGYEAFFDCDSLASVSIPASVVSIVYGTRGAFSGCGLLTSAGPAGSGAAIEFGWTDVIPDYAFADCGSLASVTIPGGVSSIGSEAFRDCDSLASVTIPEGVSSIGERAFAGCYSLASVSIPASVTSMDCINYGYYAGAFSSCGRLTSAGPAGSGAAIEFGWTDVIPDNAFAGCGSLASVTIPGGVSSIGERAFYDCGSLASVYIPDGVTSIGFEAFGCCTSLASVSIPQSWTGDDASFWGCDLLTTAGPVGSGAAVELRWEGETPGVVLGGFSSLVSVSIPDSVTSIGESAFAGCSALASLTIPDSVTSIGEGAFAGCSALASLTIPSSVTSIHEEAFYHMSSLASIAVVDGNAAYWSDGRSLISSDGKLLIYANASGTSYAVPNAVTEIAHYAFQCGSVVSISIPGSVASIDAWAFYNCDSLASVELAEGVREICYHAFYDCDSLAIVAIPASVNAVYNQAFENCPSLTDVYYGGSEAQRRGSFDSIIGFGNDCLEDATWHYSESSQSGTCGADGDNLYWYITDAGTLVIEGSGAMADFSSGGAPWFYCDDIESVTVGWGVTSIGDYAFEACALSSVTIPSSVTSIGKCAFAGSSLTSVSIPRSVTTIGVAAFQSCCNLESVYIPLTWGITIDSGAFWGCDSLVDVYYAGTEGNRATASIGSFNDPLEGATWHYGGATLYGDVNGNGVMNIMDAQVAYDIACGLYVDRDDYEQLRAAADVDGSGDVTALDARAIQYAVHYGWGKG